MIDESDKLPAAALFGNPRLLSPVLSPDGTKIAGIRADGAEDHIVVLSVDRLEDERIILTEKRSGRSGRASRRISMLGWPNDNRIVYGIETPLASREDSWTRSMGRDNFLSRQGPLGVGTRARKTRLYVSDLEGKKRWLGKRWPNAERSQYQTEILNWLPNDADFFLVEYQGDVVRVRIRNGAIRVIERGRNGIDRWHVDHEGHVRLGIFSRDWTTAKSLHARLPGERSWQKIFEFDPYAKHGVRFAALSEDPKIIYVYADKDAAGDRDKTALYTFDLERRELGRKILDDPDFDIDSGSLLSSPVDGRLLAVSHFRIGRELDVVDEEWRGVWDRITDRFPGRDIQVLSWDASAAHMLLSVSSDQSPPVTYFFDSESDRMEMLFESHPDVVGISFARTQPIWFEATDGRRIAGYVTRPVGAKGPGPTIIYPHGGPGRRDFLGWNKQVQFLVQRGFTIFRLNFRGSVGYGRDHERAGDHEWGGKIQSDISDGVAWLIAQGIADPERIGIYGAGFGGYSSLMALAREPTVYKAGASLGTISDLSEYLAGGSRFYLQGAVNDRLVGRRFRDRSQVKEASPVEHADRIKSAVFLAHGDANPRPRRLHTEEMAGALRRAGVSVEAHFYRSATATFADGRERIDFYRRLADFFERHLLTNSSVHKAASRAR